MPRIFGRNNRVQKSRGLWAGIVFLVAAAGLAAFAQQSPPAKQAPITVSAAISLKDVLDQLGREYERDNPGAKVTFNYAGSGTLQHQIEQGAPVDIFFSAAQKQMDALQSAGLILARYAQEYCGERFGADCAVCYRQYPYVSGFSEKRGENCRAWRACDGAGGNVRTANAGTSRVVGRCAEKGRVCEGCAAGGDIRGQRECRCGVGVSYRRADFAENSNDFYRSS